MARTLLAILLVSGFQTALMSGGLRFSWQIALSGVLTASVLALIAQSVSDRGWKLFGIVFCMYLGISYFNSMVEAVLFQVISGPDGARMMAFGFILASISSVLIIIGLGRVRSTAGAAVPPSELRRRAGWAWRAPLAALVYFSLYLAAGTAVWPFIKDFYATRQLPTLPQLFGVQIVRGLIFIGIVAPFVIRMGGKTRQAALVLGATFSILGGIAPLLLPNPFMPAPIRLAHGMEVGVSNFLFGLVVAYLLVNPNRGTVDLRSASPPEHLVETCI